MLRISIKPGEYFTVGGDTVVQFDRLRGDRAHLIITAPREVPILRGAVLEREGGQRPDCVVETPERMIRQLPWDGTKKAALRDLKVALAQMGGGPEVQTVREKLDCIFPAWKDE